MLQFDLTPDDTIEAFRAGLGAIGPLDAVSQHENAHRRVLLLGQCHAWGEVAGRSVPLVIGWRARVVIPRALIDGPVVGAMEALLRLLLDSRHSRWLTDIRSEARTMAKADVGCLVREDIERGELPNRLLYERGVRRTVMGQIGKLRHRVGFDPSFDWSRVRLTLDPS